MVLRKAMETVTYLCKYFLDVSVDRIFHLSNHVGRLSGNLGRLSTSCNTGNMLTNSEIQIYCSDRAISLPPILVDVAFLLHPRYFVNNGHDTRIRIGFKTKRRVGDLGP